jgi:hypothetical protein
MVRGSLFSLWLDRWSCFIPLGLPGVEWAAAHGFVLIDPSILPVLIRPVGQSLLTLAVLLGVFLGSGWGIIMTE